MKEFLDAIPAAGASPLAFGAYAILILAWTAVTVSVRRTDKLFGVVKDLPEQERLKAIELEYRTTPAKGLTAAQWLRSRKNNLLFMGFVASLVCIIILVALVLQYKAARTTQAMEQYISLSDMRSKLLLITLDVVEREHPEDARAIAQLRQEVAGLVPARMDSLKRGDLIMAQEYANRISAAYFEASKLLRRSVGPPMQLPAPDSPASAPKQTSPHPRKDEQ